MGLRGRAWASVGERGQGGELKKPKQKKYQIFAKKDPPLTFSHGHKT